MTTSYPRDLIGYGRNPPDPRWPGGARIAVQFVLNYEEGGENCILHGDAASEAFLSEIVGAQAIPGKRHMSMESIYEYGSRAGFWRILRLFEERRLPFTCYAVAMALERHGHGVAGEGQPPFLEQPQDAPEAGAGAVFVDRLHAHVALARDRLRPDDLRQEGLRRRIPVQDAVLAPLLVVEHELDGDPRPAGPAWVGRVAAVADQVAGIGGRHGGLSVRAWPEGRTMRAKPRSGKGATGALPAVPPGPCPDHRSFGPRPFEEERRVRPQAP